MACILLRFFYQETSFGSLAHYSTHHSPPSSKLHTPIPVLLLFSINLLNSSVVGIYAAAGCLAPSVAGTVSVSGPVVTSGFSISAGLFSIVASAAGAASFLISRFAGLAHS